MKSEEDRIVASWCNFGDLSTMYWGLGNHWRVVWVPEIGVLFDPIEEKLQSKVLRWKKLKKFKNQLSKSDW